MMIRATLPLLGLLCACAAPVKSTPQTAGGSLEPLTYPTPPPDAPNSSQTGTLLLQGATVMTAAGDIHAPGWILIRDGIIDSLGAGVGSGSPDTTVVDVSGQFITPGIIDTHSHMGVYASPSTRAHSDGNEMVRPTTPEIWAEHAFWPQDPNLGRALTGGITTIQVLPGSGNLIGGRSFTAKLKPATSARKMRFPNAPQGLKMACGENPKRVYGKRGGPQTRMGNVYGYRNAFQKAREYQYRQQKYALELKEWQEKATQNRESAGNPPQLPSRDFGLETLVGVLEGDILIHNHCYRADEMHIMLDLAKEFGFSIRSFHHALEAYKLADRLAQEDVSISTWSDWWGFKMEAYDGIPQNAALVARAGARVVIHSDSATEIRHLNQEAAKARASGRLIGLDFDDNEVLRWITANPAWAIGLDKQVGTIEAGKMADLVIWDRHPFSVYARANQVLIDGLTVYDRSKLPRLSDFELGHPLHRTQERNEK